MDHLKFQDWLDDYVEAWETYDPQKIGALFSEDCVYRYHPADESLKVTGRGAIIASWVDGRDDPGTYDAHYEPLAIDSDVHVAKGVSRYYDSNHELRDEYYNVYVCRFNNTGECTEFTEYWIQDRDFRRRALEEMKQQAIAEAMAESAAPAAPA